MEPRFKITRVSGNEYFESRKSPISFRHARGVTEMYNGAWPSNKPLNAEDIVNKHKDFLYTMNEVEEMTGVGRLTKTRFSEGLITDLFVDPNQRRVGYGKSLLEKVEERAVQRSIHTLRAIVKEENLPSKNLFKSKEYAKKFTYYKEGSGLKSVWEKTINKKIKRKKGWC